MVGVVVALVCAAAGTAAPPSVKALAAARERVAGRKAAKLLDRIALPAGARPARTVPAALDQGLLGVSVVTQFANRHRFWKLREPVATVVRFVKQHELLPGYTSEGFYYARNSPSFEEEFDQEPPGKSMYGLALQRQGGWTFVDVEAAAAWIYPRSPQQAIPAGVREVDVSGIGARVHVVDAKEVARIVRWFGQLSAFPPLRGVWPSCFYRGVPVTFAFRSANRAVVARVVAPSGGATGCGPVTFTIGRKTGRSLVDTTARPFVQRVGRLLGVCFGVGPYSDFRFTVQCNKAWADDVTEKLLHGLRLPSGAQSLAHEPQGDGGLLRSPASVPGSGELVDQHRFWRVRGSLASVDAFVKTHQRSARQTDSANHSVTFEYSAFARSHFPSTRQIEVTFVALPHGWTGIRADAQVAWIYPRKNRTRLTGIGTAIIVRAGTTIRSITNLRMMERIISRFDRLAVVPPGRAYSCPTVRHRGPRVMIEFHGDAWNARAVVHGTGISTACDPIRSTTEATKLIGGDFVPWLLGPRFRAATLTARASAAYESWQLLNAYVPPTRAVRLKTVPKGEPLPRSGVGGIFGKAIKRHHLWLVRLPAKAFVRYFSRRLHGWHATSYATSHSCACRTVASTEVTYGEVGFGGRATGRVLHLVAVKSRRAGWSLLRADVLVVWHLSAAEREYLPGGVHEIDIRGPNAKARVTNRDQVRTIVRWFNSLQLDEAPFSAGICGPAGPNPNVTYIFRGRHGTAARAIVPEVADSCSPASYTIGGRAQTPLLAGEVDRRVERLLGVKLLPY